MSSSDGIEAKDDDLILGTLFVNENNSQSDENEENEILIKYDTYKRSFINSSANIYQLTEPSELKLALVQQHHSLWAEFIYNAARVLADMIEQGEIICYNKSCLELGAGAGLPGLIAGLNGAKLSVISDYGNTSDTSLLRAIDINIEHMSQYIPSSASTTSNTTHTIYRSIPYIFGNNVQDILDLNNGQNYDLLFLADLLFNRSEHNKLLYTISKVLKPVTGVAWITFSHHDPHKVSMRCICYIVYIHAYICSPTCIHMIAILYTILYIILIYTLYRRPKT